ncbi:MAG TPA: DUF5752 family protein [Candidatus Acidoferrum sp.]|nr:DUF5752 family protein [Candidatus Acidoferrum sp.]
MSLSGTSKKKIRRARAKRRPTNTLARKLLSSVPKEQAFAFYLALGVPTGKYADSLQDFCQRLLEVEPQSVSFHFEREDFQNWLREAVGDEELASELSGLKGGGLHPEELRSRVYELVKSRCDELSSALEKG